MFETFYTVTGVHEALGEQAQARSTCVSCGHGARTVYPWPLPGLGMRCAVCIVKESQESAA